MPPLRTGGEAGRLDWLVFAEDWGGHPSTTQHLVAQLPASDRVLWVDSIGMRAPRLGRADVARVVGRLGRAVVGVGPSVGVGVGPSGARGPSLDAAERSEAEEARDLSSRARARPSDVAGVGALVGVGRSPDHVLHPLLLPWHDRPACVALNRRLLGAAVTRAARRLVLTRPVLATANPVLARYLDAFATHALVYLRLDDFASLPGVDASLIHATEPHMLARADLVIVPNRRLVPHDVPPERVRLLPQGVDGARFEAIPLEPPAGPPVLGYWGAIGEWLDVELVLAVARARPDCVLELRGVARAEVSVQRSVERMRQLPNVRVLPPVPHDQLARAAAHWSAAWVPFLSGHHLAHASPLKLREYLAAGLPTASTPLPEATEIGGITALAGVADALEWLADTVAHDSRSLRTGRRASMAGQGWAQRARDLRAWVAGLM